MSGSANEPLAALDALAPVDGRYRAATAPLRHLLSEAGLIRERIRIEAEWLLHLSAAGAAACPALQLAGVRTPPRLRELARRSAAPSAAAAVKAIEARINHDVKAVEYYVRQQLAAAGASEASLELVHFGCTSEDINNLSYARLLTAARTTLMRRQSMQRDQRAHAAGASRSGDCDAGPHPRSERKSHDARQGVRQLRRAACARPRAPLGVGHRSLGKWNGAVGNFNAHAAALPALDWPRIAEEFVTALGLQYNPWTTQIEPHDWIGEYCDALAALNVILIDLCRDFWGYISLGYLRQRAVAGEVGSSTMPHKVNPIDFENAEGNCGVANALLRHFSEKLPLSRWQRDLTDSTVLRNFGVALGHTLIAWNSLGRGLGKIEADPARMAQDLDVAAAWEVLAEAVQTVLRAAGRAADGYERLKEFTRGRAIDAAASLAAFIDALPLPAAEKARLESAHARQLRRACRALARERLEARRAEALPIPAPPNGVAAVRLRGAKVRTEPRF